MAVRKAPPALTPEVVDPQIEAGMAIVWSISRTGPWHPGFCRRVNGDGTLSLVVFGPGRGVSLGGYDAVRHASDARPYEEGLPVYGYWDFTARDRALATDIATLQRQVSELVDVVTK